MAFIITRTSLLALTISRSNYYVFFIIYVFIYHFFTSYSYTNNYIIAGIFVNMFFKFNI
jgi:hypothetical protein